MVTKTKAYFMPGKQRKHEKDPDAGSTLIQREKKKNTDFQDSIIVGCINKI